MSTEYLLLLLVTIFIVIILLYISTRLITTQEDIDVNYLFRLIIVAVIAVIVVPILSTIGNAIGIPEISPIIAFIGLLYAVKYIIVNEVGGVLQPYHFLNAH